MKFVNDATSQVTNDSDGKFLKFVQKSPAYEHNDVTDCGLLENGKTGSTMRDISMETFDPEFDPEFNDEFNNSTEVPQIPDDQDRVLLEITVPVINHIQPLHTSTPIKLATVPVFENNDSDNQNNDDTHELNETIHTDSDDGNCKHQKNNDGNQEKSNDFSDADSGTSHREKDVDLGKRGQSENRPFSTAHEPLVNKFSENLWPEANSSNNNTEACMNINQMKTCLKEFGGEIIKTIAQMQNTERTVEEFDLPPVQSGKVRILGSELDANEVFLAKDVPSLRKCVNHITRAYWSVEERKRLVLSDREAQKSSKTTVKNNDIEKIKQICKLMQSPRKFDKKLKENQLGNIRVWIEDVLKNSRRPPLAPEKKALYKQKAKERRQAKKKTP
ncbi:hypothetical protein KQX54_005597 [Cotesia glomerata]|uniref:Uncharacterized protein n=1 Tax=Cotesia glomerata TaxID=32391 RepID=A0AAV7J345_COTGL|nr:hypothetical protein KQX54_005597 [Cotesia glomerata]